MRKELLFTLIICQLLLLINRYRFYSKIQNWLIHNSIRKRTVIPLLLFFMSMGSYAQMATETFESGMPIPPWQSFRVNGTLNWGITSDSYQGTKAAFIDPSSENIGAGTTAQYFLATPPVPIPEHGEIRFFTKQSSAANNGAIYQIRLSTASQNDPAGYSVVLKSWTEADLNVGSQTAYEEKIVEIPSDVPVGLPVYIAFVVINTQTGATPSGDAWFIDNVRVIESCLKVNQTDFSASNITSNSANLSWTHPTATDFEIQVVLQGTTPAATGVSVSNSYSPPSLAADTSYDVYIKAICDANTASSWAGPFTFRTKILGLSCSTPIVIPFTTTPYTLSSNLNLFADNPTSYTTQGTGCLSPSTTGNFLNGSKAFFSYTPTQNGLVNIKQLTLPYSQGSGCFGNAITGVFVYEDCADVGVSCIAGLNTTETNVPKYISNLYVEAGHTYIIVISTTFDSDASVCFTFELSFATCAPPATFTLEDLTTDSVSVSWDNVGNLANSWEYVVRDAGAGIPTSSGTSTNTNIDNLINSGLAAGTSYDLYVRSVCGGVPSNWSNPYRFATQCLFNTPYVEPFTGARAASPVPCWIPLDINNDGSKWTGSFDNIRLRAGDRQGENNDMMISPIINLGTTPKRLKFKYSTSGGAVRFSVVLSTSGIAQGDFTTVLLPSQIIDTDNDQLEKIINIPESITGNINFAFYVHPEIGETAYNFFIDDVVVEDKPECSDPILLVAENITTTTADLSWTAGDAETQWQIVVQLKDTGIPTGTGELIDDSEYTAEDLTHATQYEYYVRAYCSSTQQSNWAGPFYFTTVCGVFDTPFYESFDITDANAHRSCWSFADANSDGTTWRLDNTVAAIQGRGFPFPTASYDDWLISPAINVVGTKALKFKYRAALSPFFPNPRYGVEVLMSTTNTDPASFTVVMPLMEFTNTDFIEKSLYINANGPVYIAFRVPPSFSIAGGTSVMHIDDVKVEDAPACPAPSELKAINITQNAAVLTWTPGYEETQWQVVVQAAGLGIPTVNGDLTNTNTAYATDPLQPNTQYEYYVRAYCSTTEQSEWVGPFVFTTLCTAFTTPFTETFNPGSASEECWRVVNGNADTFEWNLNMTLNPYEGEHAAVMFTGSNGNNNDWLISPTITVRAGQRLRYYYRVLGSDFQEDLAVRLSTTGIEPAQFTTVLYEVDYEDVPPLNNPEWKEKVINLPAGVTGNINIAWHIPQKDPNPWGYRGQMLVLDKVVVEDIPSCPAPNNLVVSDIIDTEAKISWDSNGTETSWDVYVQPEELPAPVGDGDAQYLHNTSSNPYIATGLTPAIRYEYYVRSVCSATEKSEWIGPFEFNTRCSFENLCEYTITLSGAGSSGVGGGIDVMQNGVKLQTLEFPTGPWNETPAPVDFTVFLCTGVEFSLFWDSVGTAPGQYPGALIEVKDSEGNTIWTGDLGTITPRSTIYRGLAICGVITCPQPTNLAVSQTGVLSWTAGGTETQWEVGIQPLNNATLPQSGTVVTTTSYTPLASDFANLTAGTYEFFVRAVCGTNNTSYWSGPKKFVRNDDASRAINIPVNATASCGQSVTKASFIGATVSAEPMSCSGVNRGDVWFEFVATSKVHVLELSNFSAKNRYQSGNNADEVSPKITLTLYKVGGTGLEEMVCTYNNVIVMAYSTELEVGATYKVRATLNDIAPNACTFDVCVTTPEDFCAMDIVNGGFERPEADFGLGNFYSQNMVPAWRSNFTEEDTELYTDFFFGNALGIDGYMPYEGGQVIQVLGPDSDEPTDPSDLVNVKGTFQDLDSSEITQFKYSYAHSARGSNSSLQLLAGPPSGPFVLVEDHLGTLSWNFYEGTYDVPAGQEVTRFVFRSKDNAIGNILDAVSIVANTDIETESVTLACHETSTLLEAQGVGSWSAAENNPAQAIIESPNNKSTTISGFNTPGTYTFYWKTRYCDKSITVIYNGFSDVPTVVSPVEYCLNAVSQPLTATPTENYTLKWYTDEVGGTGTLTAPTPETDAVGTTTYYVSNVDTNGCEGPRVAINVTVSERTAAEVGFLYDDTNYCILGANPIITLNPGFTTGGTFGATPEGLSINTTTGEINLSASTAGTYSVKYAIGMIGCTDAGENTVSVTIEPAIAPVVDFTYQTPVCLNNANLLPALGTGFTAGGTFGSETLSVNPLTGEIDMTTATAGNHTITYNLNSDTATCTDAGNSSFQVQIDQNTVPVTNFTYQASYCKTEANPLPTLPQDFYVGGVFEATGSLVINTTTGEIDLANSPAGAYSITYNVAPSGCNTGGSHTQNITINALVAPQVTFSYDNACINSTANPLPILPTGFSTGGTFASTTITVNPTTGEISLAGATEGTHQIVYTLAQNTATCTEEGEFTATIVLTSGITPVTGFTYNETYCSSNSNDLPELAAGFTSGGSFRAPSGLVINAVTGEISISQSTPGIYQITYEIASNTATCNLGGSSNFTITITENIQAEVTKECVDQVLWLTAVPVNGSFNPDMASYTWKDGNGLTVGGNSDRFNVNEYIEQHPNATMPMEFTVAVTSGSCSNTASLTVDGTSCKLIPKGISPNNDTFNDSFDLSGMGVRHISIFNRYGKEVYKFKGNYTNEWHGQSSDGKELPDATYFYSISKQDGTTVTGWVYINREY